MLQKLRKAVVSVLLVAITITLTLTLTVSATATTSTSDLKEVRAILSTRQQGNGTVTTTAETTTTTFLALQPPTFNVASATTSSYEPESDSKDVTIVETSSIPKNSINHESEKSNNVVVNSNKTAIERGIECNIKAKKEEKESTVNQVEKEINKLKQDELSHNASSPICYSEVLLPAGFESNADNSKFVNNSLGYIHFETRRQNETIDKQEQKRTKRVNEVLASLFPNGFSDIFRFSYASEPTTTATSNQLNNKSTTISTNEFSTTSSKPEYKPSVSFTSSISREYRRLVSPGQTEIVVEQLGVSSSSEEFKDGSNAISKDELYRINRAAVDAHVLPSLLVEPLKSNKTDKPTAPIVILKENLSESDDLSDEIDDDNQIAETQDVSQNVYQRLTNDGGKLSYRNKTPEINVEIIEEIPLRQTHKREFGQRLFTPASELPKKELLTKSAVSTPIDPAKDQQSPRTQDHYQQHAEQTFQQPDSAPEAPSRKFLKNFNPQLSESSSGLVKKGNFHYELIGRQQRLQSATQSPDDYSNQYSKPAAQLQYQRQSQQRQQEKSQEKEKETLQAQIAGSQPVTTSPDYRGYESTPIQENSAYFSPPDDIVFVTVNTPGPHIIPAATPISLFPPSLLAATPYDYVEEAVGAASQKTSQKFAEAKPNNGYTYVEVQKSVNIHNKLITEKDGKLIEQHETIYHQPQYGQTVAINQEEVAYSPKQYISLNANPIRVQNIDEENDETYEKAESQTASHRIYPPAQGQSVQINYVEKVVPHPYPVQVEQLVERPYPVPQVVEKPVASPVHVNEVVEKVVDRPVQVEKFIDRPIKVPYPVHVNHYIDRPYPVREIIEQHVAVPYAVPEPVAVPVPVETYIDRPYAVETIVEKPVPYPVEKIVEKVVEKHVPIEVERIVEKPKVVEKVVEKIFDRPIAIPIHVPVGVPVPPYPNEHPNSLPWSSRPIHSQRNQKIPPKVLQNYYTRMLKKLLSPQITNLEGKSSPASISSSNHMATKPTQPAEPIQFTKLPFKISDILLDLKPPPPPLGPSWAKGARYIYNTLPSHLSTVVQDQDFGPQQQINFVGPAPLSNDDESYHEFQRWRNGHVLKRSPDFGRSLHIEYGFKPPLIPSLEIDDKGMPLNSKLSKSDE